MLSSRTCALRCLICLLLGMILGVALDLKYRHNQINLISDADNPQLNISFAPGDVLHWYELSYDPATDKDSITPIRATFSSVPAFNPCKPKDPKHPPKDPYACVIRSDVSTAGAFFYKCQYGPCDPFAGPQSITSPGGGTPLHGFMQAFEIPGLGKALAQVFTFGLIGPEDFSLGVAPGAPARIPHPMPTPAPPSLQVGCEVANGPTVVVNGNGGEVQTFSVAANQSFTWSNIMGPGIQITGLDSAVTVPSCETTHARSTTCTAQHPQAQPYSYQVTATGCGPSVGETMTVTNATATPQQ